MPKLFDQENPVFKTMSVVFSLIHLNLLTLACCLPIVTAGAAFTAMHRVLWRLVRHEETYITKEFLEAFRRNFRQASVLWFAVLRGFGRGYMGCTGVLFRCPACSSVYAGDCYRRGMRIFPVFVYSAVSLRVFLTNDREERRFADAWVFSKNLGYASCPCLLRWSVRDRGRSGDSPGALVGCCAAAISLCVAL
ncbi:MAG: hypothetical protein ACFWT0_00025 [Bifidobacterium crudilactis]|jgi:hypothetical protein